MPYTTDMTWASRRRFLYLAGVILFFAVVFGIPLALWMYEPPTCFDGRQNQGETGIDAGGPCPTADVRTLTPPAIMWARSFAVRAVLPKSENGTGGMYNAVAYIENPNDGVGVLGARYRFKLYDENNVLVAERDGEMFIMPGSITPIFEGQLETGNRIAARTFFEFTGPLTWERLEDIARFIEVGNKALVDTDLLPRGSARVVNTSVHSLRDITLVAAAFDAAGNAIAASQTALPRLSAGEAADVVFSWPQPFGAYAARFDVIPVIAPEPMQ